MITVLFNEVNKSIDLFFDDYEIDYSYNLGEGILSILNYNLSIIDSRINKYIDKAINGEIISNEEVIQFFDFFHCELINFHPFFVGLLNSDLQLSFIESLITYLLEHDLVGEYKYAQPGIPFPVIKEGIISQRNGYDFISIVQKLILEFAGDVDEVVGDEFIESVKNKYDFYIPDIVILAMYYYKKYCIYYERQGGFEILTHSLKIKEYEIKNVQDAVKEFINYITSSENIEPNSAINIFPIKIFNYIQSALIDDNFTFSYLFKSNETIPNVDVTHEYSLENIFELVLLEVYLMSQYNMKFYTCKKCHSYTMKKISTGCKNCSEGGIVYKKNISDLYNSFLKKFNNYIDIKLKKDITKQNALCKLKSDYENIIISLTDLVRENKVTMQQFKNCLSLLYKLIEDFEVKDFEEYKQYLSDLHNNLDSDELLSLIEGNENSLYILINKPIKNS